MQISFKGGFDYYYKANPKVCSLDDRMEHAESILQEIADKKDGELKEQTISLNVNNERAVGRVFTILSQNKEGSPPVSELTAFVVHDVKKGDNYLSLVTYNKNDYMVDDVISNKAINRPMPMKDILSGFQYNMGYFSNQTRLNLKHGVIPELVYKKPYNNLLKIDNKDDYNDACVLLANLSKKRVGEIDTNKRKFF